MVKAKNKKAEIKALSAPAESDKEKKPLAVIEATEYGLRLRNLDDMFRFGEYIVKAEMVPVGETPESCVIKLQYGAELGLRPMASVQNIAVINRRPVLWGDAVPAVVLGSGLMVDYREREVGTRFQDDYGWEITSLRKGYSKPMVTVFTVAEIGCFPTPVSSKYLVIVSKAFLCG